MCLSVYHKISSKSVNIGTSDFKSPKIKIKDRFFFPIKNIFFKVVKTHSYCVTTFRRLLVAQKYMEGTYVAHLVESYHFWNPAWNQEYNWGGLLQQRALALKFQQWWSLSKLKLLHFRQVTKAAYSAIYLLAFNVAVSNLLIIIILSTQLECT